MEIQKIIDEIQSVSGWSLDEKAMKKDYKKYLKIYKKMGRDEEEAHDKAVFFIDFYSHHYKLPKRVLL